MHRSARLRSASESTVSLVVDCFQHRPTLKSGLSARPVATTSAFYLASHHCNAVAYINVDLEGFK